LCRSHRRKRKKKQSKRSKHKKRSKKVKKERKRKESSGSSTEEERVDRDRSRKKDKWDMIEGKCKGFLSSVVDPDPVGYETFFRIRKNGTYSTKAFTAS
jgi:hypothetical protein